MLSHEMNRLHGVVHRAREAPLSIRFCGTILLVLAAVAARFALAGAEPGHAFLTFFAAVLLSAVLFGRWLGSLATFASTAVAVWLFVPAGSPFLLDSPRDAAAALTFVATGLGVAWLTSAARHSIRERDATNAALREGQQRLRTVLENIGEPFYAIDADWRILHASRAALEIWRRRPEQVIGRRVLEVLPEAAGSAPFAALQQVMHTRSPARLEAVSGVTKRWVAVDIYPAEDGGLSVAFRDIHERKLAEERQRLLIGETAHRIKNTLALVLAIAEQTRRTVSSPDAFHAVFHDRLAALARAHDALRRDGGTATTLDVVAGEALAPYLGASSSRMEIVGPEVRVTSGAAVTLGMAFHELATNAAKHGALSTLGGRVRLSWQRPDGHRAASSRECVVLWRRAAGHRSPGHRSSAGLAPGCWNEVLPRKSAARSHSTSPPRGYAAVSPLRKPTTIPKAGEVPVKRRVYCPDMGLTCRTVERRAHARRKIGPAIGLGEHVGNTRRLTTLHEVKSGGRHCGSAYQSWLRKWRRPTRPAERRRAAYCPPSRP